MFVLLRNELTVRKENNLGAVKWKNTNSIILTVKVGWDQIFFRSWALDCRGVIWKDARALKYTPRTISVINTC